MLTGLIHDVSTDKYYYAQSDGTLVIGWLNLDGSYYHMENDGSLGTGWKTTMVPNIILIRLPAFVP